jgi:hypothetical protein
MLYFLAEQSPSRTFTGATTVDAPQRLNLRGAFNHPRRAPTAFDAASHRYLLPVCPGAKAESSVILIGRPPNKTFGAIELNHARGAIAEICGLVGRDTQGWSQRVLRSNGLHVAPSYGRNDTPGKATGEQASIHPGSCPGQAFAGTCARCRNKDGTRADGGAGGWRQSHFFACSLARFRSRRG